MSTRSLGFAMAIGGRFDTKGHKGATVHKLPDAFGMFTGRTQSGKLLRFGVEQIIAWEGVPVRVAPYPKFDDYDD